MTRSGRAEVTGRRTPVVLAQRRDGGLLSLPKLVADYGEESPSPVGSLPTGMQPITDIAAGVAGQPIDEWQLLEKADVPGCH